MERGLGDRYRPPLLLINLLLEVHLPVRPEWTDSCHFLGKMGCCLKARHVLCINYLCEKIRKMLAHEDLIRLQQIVGEEMETAFRLQERVMKIIGTDRQWE